MQLSQKIILIGQNLKKTKLILLGSNFYYVLYHSAYAIVLKNNFHCLNKD